MSNALFLLDGGIWDLHIGEFFLADSLEGIRIYAQNRNQYMLVSCLLTSSAE